MTSSVDSTTQAIPTTDLAGHVVLWDFSTSEISYSDVRDALIFADLDPDLAKELRPAAAFSRAAKGLKEERRIDKVKQEKGTVRFQLTHIDNDGERIDFDRETEIMLDGETGEITCPDRGIQQQARELFAAALVSRTGNDLTKMVQFLFKENADLFPVVPEKGVAYFVPIEHAKFLEKVQQFAVACGGSLYMFPVPKGTPAGDKSVSHTIASGLQGMVDELNQTVAEFDVNTRTSTQNKMVDKWQKISYKTEAYAAYLDDERGKLIESLNSAKVALTAKILAVETAKAEAKEEAKTESSSAVPEDNKPTVDSDPAGSAAADAILEAMLA